MGRFHNLVRRGLEEFARSKVKSLERRGVKGKSLERARRSLELRQHLNALETSTDVLARSKIISDINNLVKPEEPASQMFSPIGKAMFRILKSRSEPLELKAKALAVIGTIKYRPARKFINTVHFTYENRDWNKNPNPELKKLVETADWVVEQYATATRYWIEV